MATDAQHKQWDAVFLRVLAESAKAAPLEHAAPHVNCRQCDRELGELFELADAAADEAVPAVADERARRIERARAREVADRAVPAIVAERENMKRNGPTLEQRQRWARSRPWKGPRGKKKANG